MQDVSISLEPGELLGLIGENGAGKSTLMNILGGVIQPDQGQMWIKGKPYRPSDPSEAKRMGIAFIHQELNLFTNLSILDNMFIDGFPRLGRTPLINRRKANHMTRKFLEAVALDVHVNTIVEHLAPGERQLVESAPARESDRLFKIIGRLRREQRTILYISHNLGDVLQLSDSIAVLRDGCVVDARRASEYTTDKMITQMVGRDISQLYPPHRSSATTETALEVEGLTQRGIVRDITFSLCNG